MIGENFFRENYYVLIKNNRNVGDRNHRMPIAHAIHHGVATAGGRSKP